MNMKLGERSQSRSERFGVKKNMLPLPKIEPRFLGCLARSLMSVPTHPNRAKIFESRAKVLLTPFNIIMSGFHRADFHKIHDDFTKLHVDLLNRI